MNSPAFALRAEIRRAGPVSFARFMELALYAPGCGYYERPRPIGRRGDFFTSPSVGPLFGQMLAFQFALWLAQIAPPTPPARLQIVEAGAHNGQLALDILAWLRQWRPELDLDYCLIEPSPARRSWQQKTLQNQFSNVQWAGHISQLGPRRVRGVVFSNELLDAMPAHQLCWDAAGQRWLERLVDLRADDFVFQHAPPSPALAPFLPEVPPSSGGPAPPKAWAAASFSPWTTAWTARNGSAPSAPAAPSAPTRDTASAKISWPTPAGKTLPRMSIFPPCARPGSGPACGPISCSANPGS
jgi:SAM-dependent MidA family methyltransferase